MKEYYFVMCRRRETIAPYDIDMGFNIAVYGDHEAKRKATRYAAYNKRYYTSNEYIVKKGKLSVDKEENVS